MIVVEKANCTGCHACVAICQESCITMEVDPEGFLYPSVDQSKCIQCGRCDEVCPVINPSVIKNVPRAYACKNKDESVRLESSSGGIFTLIAEQIIDRHGVVFGAGFDEDFMISHSYVETKEDLSRFRGSKYVESMIGNTYKEAKDFLDTGREVLFSGTPCQIAGLKSYLGQPYKHLFCIDIICFGVPSPKVWQKYMEYMKQHVGDTIQNISFRNKINGSNLAMTISFDNGTKYYKALGDDLFLKTFLKYICLRPSCYSCAFKTLHRQSDISLGDFWGIQDLLPEFDDDKGVSLIVINSEKGQAMLNCIENKMEHKDIDINQAVKYNRAAIKPVKYNELRPKFFRKLDRVSFDRLVKQYCYTNLYRRINSKLKRMVSK